MFKKYSFSVCTFRYFWGWLKHRAYLLVSASLIHIQTVFLFIFNVIFISYSQQQIGQQKQPNGIQMQLPIEPRKIHILL